jgi:hypothetical protein
MGLVVAPVVVEAVVAMDSVATQMVALLAHLNQPLVAAARFALFGRAQLAPSHQQTQVICNETLYSTC